MRGSYRMQTPRYQRGCPVRAAVWSELAALADPREGGVVQSELGDAANRLVRIDDEQQQPVGVVSLALSADEPAVELHGVEDVRRGEGHRRRAPVGPRDLGDAVGGPVVAARRPRPG